MFNYKYMFNFKSTTTTKIIREKKSLTKTTKQIGPTRLQTTLSYIDNQQLKKKSKNNLIKT